MRYLLFLFVFLITIQANAQQKPQQITVVDGVSWQLAQWRKKTISNINYKLEFSIPALAKLPIKAVEEIVFNLNDLSENLQIDFAEETRKIIKISVNGRNRDIVHYNQHIIIDKRHLRRRKNKIKIQFIAGNSALNRNPDYLYTLFVPDRMRTSIPSFDQPNLKAKFDLTLNIPQSWKTISSAPIKKRIDKNMRSSVEFEQSDYISTYLFSFVAGQFNEITKTIDGREMTMLHRETDQDKIDRNLEQIFKLHKSSIDYMEDYTGIKFPFKKFAFVLIPSFQFGGMEHVGAIQYKASSIMLDENPATTDLLGRAALIGHETAHMWFGDLVTMDWFNDVWTKEVFANFMSAKLVNPSFPTINHSLRTHLRLHPGAYAVDRSQGPNPIRQQLDNLNQAGSLYGAIIYNKAPIMMQQLEKMLGQDNFRDGLRQYLKTYAHSSATWPQLIEILDKRSEQDLKKWSDVWVNSAGRPIFKLEKNGSIMTLSQSDPSHQGRNWPQTFKIRNGEKAYEVTIGEEPIDLEISTKAPLLINADGAGYGLFPIENNLLREKWDLLTDLERASAFISLYEQTLNANQQIKPYQYMELIIWAINRENNPLIINHLMRQTVALYWSYLNPIERDAIAQKLEQVLWKEINSKQKTIGERKIYFKTYANIAITDQSVQRLIHIWDNSETIEGLMLTIRDYTELAAILAIKRPDQAITIINQQSQKIQNPDRQRRFEFIRTALSPDQHIRDQFFETLKNPENRKIEAWVLTALNYLHHPLRLKQSEKYLKPSLDLLQEIQITGDLFFPGRWVEANFKNYKSDSAVAIVRSFLKEKPDYNKQLTLKILQGADRLFKANKIIKPIH